MSNSNTRSAASVFAIVALGTASLGILAFFLPFITDTLFSTHSMTGWACAKDLIEEGMASLAGCMIYAGLCNLLVLPFAAIAIKIRSMSIPAMALSLLALMLMLVAAGTALSQDMKDLADLFSVRIGIGVYLFGGAMLATAVLSVVALAIKSAAVAPKAAIPIAPVPAVPVPPVSAATVLCPSCGADNDSASHFCFKCGTPMDCAPKTPARCGSCGAVLSEKNRFCPVCGTPNPNAEAPVMPKPEPAAPAARYGYTPPAIPKEERSCICPNCGARQLPSRFCRYCGTFMQ